MISTRRRAFLRLKALMSLPLSGRTTQDAINLAVDAGVLIVGCYVIDFANTETLLLPLASAKAEEFTLASAKAEEFTLASAKAEEFTLASAKAEEFTLASAGARTTTLASVV